MAQAWGPEPVFKKPASRVRFAGGYNCHESSLYGAAEGVKGHIHRWQAREARSLWGLLSLITELLELAVRHADF